MMGSSTTIYTSDKSPFGAIMQDGHATRPTMPSADTLVSLAPKLQTSITTTVDRMSKMSQSLGASMSPVMGSMGAMGKLNKPLAFLGRCFQRIQVMKEFSPAALLAINTPSVDVVPTRDELATIKAQYEDVHQSLDSLFHQEPVSIFHDLIHSDPQAAALHIPQKRTSNTPPIQKSKRRLLGNSVASASNTLANTAPIAKESGAIQYSAVAPISQSVPINPSRTAHLSQFLGETVFSQGLGTSIAIALKQILQQAPIAPKPKAPVAPIAQAQETIKTEAVDPQLNQATPWKEWRQRLDTLTADADILMDRPQQVIQKAAPQEEQDEEVTVDPKISQIVAPKTIRMNDTTANLWQRNQFLSRSIDQLAQNYFGQA